MKFPLFIAGSNSQKDVPGRNDKPLGISSKNRLVGSERTSREVTENCLADSHERFAAVETESFKSWRCDQFYKSSTIFAPPHSFSVRVAFQYVVHQMSGPQFSPVFRLVACSPGSMSHPWVILYDQTRLGDVVLANALVVLSSTAEDGEIEVRILVGCQMRFQAGSFDTRQCCRLCITGSCRGVIVLSCGASGIVAFVELRSIWDIVVSVAVYHCNVLVSRGDCVELWSIWDSVSCRVADHLGMSGLWLGDMTTVDFSSIALLIRFLQTGGVGDRFSEHLFEE
uniref:Uncharacterized protein n=1 Tax=Timema tahoe TaxID=61484 RepID=A0A7R9IMV7_9NEOP|nr:unnamed protein product [Timema tahoe]